MSGTVRHVARITVELASPLAVGSGAWDELMDSPFALDASGLPTIPGTSLAGALRSRWQRATTEQDTKRLFGFQERVRAGEEDGAASEVHISFAAIHDSQGRPAACRLDPEAIESDPVLRFARLGLVRPHVRIDHRGAADALGRGLFDRSQVAVGHRFSFELSIQGNEVRDTDLLELLATLESASFRLGGRSRSGLGRFEIKEILLRRFDLRDHDDYDDYCRLPVDLNEAVPAGVLRPVPIEEVRAQATAKSTGATCVLEVTPRGFWLIGGGRASDDCGEMHRVDIAPYSEPRVIWRARAGRGEIGEVDWTPRDFPLPASGIKGALRHRTAFHLNRLTGSWARDGGDPARLLELDGLHHPEICKLFGEALVHGEGAEPKNGRAGRVWIDEIRPIPESRARIPHVALDRFTCGPIDGALFEEEVLWKRQSDEPWQLVIRIEPAASEEVDCPPVHRALRLAIGDLAKSALQMGSGSGRGHGWLEGSITWIDPQGAFSLEEVADVE